MNMRNELKDGTVVQVSTNAPGLASCSHQTRDRSEYAPVSKAAPETALKRLEDLLAMGMVPEAGTNYGCMTLRGEITKGQFRAIEWFASLRARYLRAIDAKEIKSGSAEMLGASHPPDPASDRGEQITKNEIQVTKEYRSAELAGFSCGKEDWNLFCHFVFERGATTWAARKAVQNVAEALRAHKDQGSRHRRGRR